MYCWLPSRQSDLEVSLRSTIRSESGAERQTNSSIELIDELREREDLLEQYLAVSPEEVA